MGKIMILTFKDSEEALLKRLIDSLGALEYQQVELPTEPLLKIGNLSLYPLESRIEQDGKKLYIRSPAVSDTLPVDQKPRQNLSESPNLFFGLGGRRADPDQRGYPVSHQRASEDPAGADRKGVH